MSKYDLIANELVIIYKLKVQILPYVMTWDGIVTKCYKKYVAEIGIQPKTKAYIQSLVHTKMFSLLTICGFDKEGLTKEMCERIIVSKLVVGAISA